MSAAGSPPTTHLVTFKPSDQVRDLAMKIDELLRAEDADNGSAICAMLCIINQLMQQLPVHVQAMINTGSFGQFMGAMFRENGSPAQYRGAVAPESERKM